MLSLLIPILSMVCGTSPENSAEVAAFHQWNAQRLRSRLTAHAATPVSYSNAIFVMPPDERVTPGHHPLDLVGRTLYARRLDGDRFEITNGALQYRDAGSLLKSIFREANPSHAEYEIKAFSFPFGALQQKKLYISAFGGIYFSTPPKPLTRQHSSAVTAVVNPVPVIAPLLIPKVTKMSTAEIFVREQPDAVIVTWRFTSGSTSDPIQARFAGDIQAVLHANGDVEFSYKSFVRFLGGAPVLTTGAEAFRTERQAIASATDDAGDVNGVEPPFPAGMYDLRTIELNRISDVDLVEIRATVAQTIDLAQIPGTSDSVITLRVGIVPRSGEGANFTYFDIKRSGNQVQYPDQSQSSYAGEFSGATIRLLMPQAFLPSGAADIEVAVLQQMGVAIADRDNAFLMNVLVTPPARTLNMDVSAFNTTRVSLPVVETFTVPRLDPMGVWEALQTAYGFTNEEIDTVAIYTSFPTDIDSINAAAYSTVGNAGADGIGVFQGRIRPRSPALLHMNTAYIPGPLLHEFGHRWLFRISAKDGASMVSLTNGTAHHRQTLDTTAAFSDGASAVGGVRWRVRGERLFERVCGTSGYSWLDLYLMGLARPEEVPPVIDLGNASVPGCGSTVEADKKVWTLQQIIDANGPRLPAYEQSQKRFRIAWVLIEDPALTFPGAAAAVRSYADRFEEDFRWVTGTRGSVVRAHPDLPPKRRATRH